MAKGFIPLPLFGGDVLAAIEQADSAAFEGEVTGFVGTLAATEAADVASANGYLPPEGIVKVGTNVSNTAVSGANYSIDLTAITDLQPGDLVIVATGHYYRAGMSLTPKANDSGGADYTAVVTPMTTQTNHFGVYRRVMPDPVDTAIYLPGSGNSSDAECAVASVWRNVDPNTLIGDTNTANGSSTNPNPASVTTSFNSDVVIVAAGSRVYDTPSSAPTGYAGTGAMATDTNPYSAALAWRSIASGGTVEDPSAFGGWNTGGWNAITLVLRATIQSVVAAFEAGDASDFDGEVLNDNPGTLQVTEASDSSSIIGLTEGFGELEATEADETASFAGEVFDHITGTLEPTEGSDASAFAGLVEIDGALAATEAPSTAEFIGKAGAIGEILATESHDVSEFIALRGALGTLAATEADDTADFDYIDFGILAATDAPDVAAFEGSTARQGSMVAHEAADAIVVEGLVGLIGFYSILEARDTGIFVGSLGQVGTLSVSELEDTAAFNAEISFGPEVYVALDRSEPDDQTALFSNLNDDLKIELDGLSLVGRSVELRGEAETIIPQRPLRLISQQLIIDMAQLDELLGVSLGFGSLSEMLGAAAQLDVATVEDIRAGASDVLMEPATAFDSQAYVTLTDAAPIAWDQDTGFNFTVTLSTSRQLAFPTNPREGKSGMLEIKQPAGGGANLTFAAGFKFDGGAAPTIDTAANRVTGLFWHCRSVTEVWIGLSFLGVR